MVRLPGEIEIASSGHVEHVCDIQSRQQVRIIGVVLATDVQVLGEARWVAGRARLRIRVQYFSHAVDVVLVVFRRFQVTAGCVVIVGFHSRHRRLRLREGKQPTQNELPTYRPIAALSDYIDLGP